MGRRAGVEEEEGGRAKQKGGGVRDGKTESCGVERGLTIITWQH